MVNYNLEDLESHDGVAAIIKNKKGQVLMQEHVKYGFWTIPVGKVKVGQKIGDALREEIHEECNLIINSCRELLTKEYVYTRNRSRVKVIAHLFEVVAYSGTLKNNEPQKHRQQLFMDIETIKKLPYLSDLTLLYLQKLGLKRKAKI